jgi:alpha-amylase/alpha-mannosidase (GH57 family)
MTKEPLCVAFLWHMHQPDYGNVRTGEIYLPWTRFHAIKDYYDMAALVDQAPGMRMTINVVPSLLDQLETYGEGKARETYAALTLKNAADLDDHEMEFLLRAFFQLSWKQMVFPYPRYKELLDKRGSPDQNGNFPHSVRRYSTQDFRDLQVWYNLAWCGRELRRDSLVASLFRKGSSFSEEDKGHLLNRQYGFIRGILPLYRRLADENRIEFSVSPYYHPILPLLCDTHSAREALPSLPLPSDSFTWRGDAHEHLQRARRRYLEIFNQAPHGTWPSEGSLSDDALDLIRELGFRWAASDEGVLYNSLCKAGAAGKSLSAAQKFSAYGWGGDDSDLCLFFRDHGLSDLIGFTYSNWSTRDAVSDFLNHLLHIHELLPSDERRYVVPIILDGENAWEHYPQNGVEFLTQLYTRLAESKVLRPVTFSEYLDGESHRESLKSIVAGSWIYSSLATWIGHEEKNRAWEMLASARRFLQECQMEHRDNENVAKAFQEMMIAEGSDWFWWFGDDHQTANAAEFDELFRSHIKNVYRLLDHPYPPGLDVPIKSADVKPHYRNPVHTISPRLDGKVSDYYEWISAGFATPWGGEAMHKMDKHIEKIYFGYDIRNFYLRADLVGLKHRKFSAAACVQVHFVSPETLILSLERDDQKQWTYSVLKSRRPSPEVEFAGGTILELGVALDALNISKPEEARFYLRVLENEQELERFPAFGFFEILIDPWSLDHEEWMV